MNNQIRRIKKDIPRFAKMLADMMIKEAIPCLIENDIDGFPSVSMTISFDDGSPDLRVTLTIDEPDDDDEEGGESHAHD